LARVTAKALPTGIVVLPRSPEVIVKLDDNILSAIVTPDKDIIPGATSLKPAFIVFSNYEKILKWNRSLRFAIAVCTLKVQI